MACAWVMQARVQDNLANTWMGRLGYCVPLPAPSTSWDCPPVAAYVVGLYYAAATITSIGYGDITPTLTNTGEVFVAAILMFSSCVVWAHLIGVFSGVISNFSPEANEFRSSMDKLNRFIHAEALPEQLARRMREYFHQSKHLRAAKSQQTLLSSLPPKLQGEASWATNQTWLTTIVVLQNAEPQFMLELSLHLHAVIFSPSDLAPTGFMFIMQRGIAMYRGKVRTKGQVWGEDVVLHSEHLRSTASARALNYVAAYYISRAELLMLADRFPKASQLIRRFAIRLALGRQIVALARVVQDQQRGSSKLDGVRLADEFVSTISGAVQLQKIQSQLDVASRVTLQKGIANTDTNEDINASNGGRLEGYKSDMGVQFEILTNKVEALRDEIKTEQAAMAATLSGALKEAITQLRADMGLPMSVPAANSVGNTHEPPAPRETESKAEQQMSPLLRGLQLFA